MQPRVLRPIRLNGVGQPGRTCATRRGSRRDTTTTTALPVTARWLDGLDHTDTTSAATGLKTRHVTPHAVGPPWTSTIRPPVADALTTCAPPPDRDVIFLRALNMLFNAPQIGVYSLWDNRFPRRGDLGSTPRL